MVGRQSCTQVNTDQKAVRITKKRLESPVPARFDKRKLGRNWLRAVLIDK
jgi:hypothetical protein